MPYFDDQMFHGVPGNLNPWDVRFDPSDAAYLSIESNGRVRFRLVTEPSFRRATVVIDDGVGYDMERLFSERSTRVWETTVDVADGARYTFALETDDGRPVYRVPAGIGNAVERLDRWVLDLSTTRTAITPAWTHGMVMYQIFPERFHNGNDPLSPEGVVPWGTDPAWFDFQGGDLVGITAKADHIESLGVDCVYLNPIFESLSTHRYDAIDYHTVDPDTYMEYLERFAATSGVGVERAIDDGPGVEVTYEAWYGVPSLPRVDLSNPDARDYFLEVARHWIRDFRIDGWRMDVARYVDFDFWPEFREAVKGENPDAYLIAEIMGNASPWLQGDMFDATMNYTFRQLVLDFAANRAAAGSTWPMALLACMRPTRPQSPPLPRISSAATTLHDSCTKRETRPIGSASQPSSR